jgi:major membrane immunogen (membrane-anchored lipoprotein)
MKSKNYISVLFILFLISWFPAQTQNSGNLKDSVLEKTHWMIERSDINTVRQQFQAICKENKLKTAVSELKDGIYRGETPADDYGYRHQVQFEMKNGKMISIDYDEVHLDGHAKQHDQDYCSRMSVSGTTPAIAYPKYESQMLEKQDFSQVDAVSGASYSLYRFRLAILYAISNSEKK